MKTVTQTIHTASTPLNPPLASGKDRTIETVARPDGLRVMLLISNLEYGGAQRQVVALANRLNACGIETHVVCLSDYVPLAKDLHDAEHRLYVVAKHAKFDVSVVPRLAKLLHKLRVGVVHGFLFDAEISARLAAMLNGRTAVIGSERNTDYKRKWRHTLALRLTGRCMDAVIANSHAGKRFQMRTLGIPETKLFVVHNGVDVERFAPHPVPDLRRELGIPRGARVVGMFASFKRQKNHRMYFRVARQVLAVHPDCRFLCVGSELHGGLQSSDRYLEEMQAEIRSTDLANAVMCLGNRDDVHDVYNLCDVTVLTSRREGTPNVLLESMACAVPVVATDVADNAIVAPDGRVGNIVPYDDDRTMADRILAIFADEQRRRNLGTQARQWVEREFSLDALMHKTLDVYTQVLRAKRGDRL